MTSQHNLLARVMAVDDVEGGVERLEDDPYDHLALVHRKRLNVERKRGNVKHKGRQKEKGVGGQEVADAVTRTRLN